MTPHGRVLLVEDEETLATTLAEMLRRRGLDCVVAGTVEGGLAALRESPFDAIVTDIHLPDGNNMEMLGELRAIQGVPPVIIITGFPSLENALQAIERQAYAYRIKPFDFDDLLGLVESAVTHGKLRRRIARSSERVTELAETLDRLRANGTRASSDSIDQSVADYLLLLLGNNAESLAEAIEVIQSLVGERSERPVRALSRHPEAEMFRSAITHTIEVLEATRRTFKSKELAELRRQLEVALKAAKEIRR